MSTDFPHLFSPFRLRTFEVKNRIVMPPMAVYYPGSNGYVCDSMVDYYDARAAGGVGWIIVAATYVHPNGNSHPNMTAITDDKYIPGMARLVKTIHGHGIPASLQLYHSGRQRYALVAGGQTISPSGIPDPVRKDPAKAPTVDEIKSLVEDYGKAAGRAQQAGFDGIELHCAHGYLLAGFLSPYQNKRTDEYGGDLVGRTRIVREILAECRKVVGESMLIGVRLNGSDYINEGNGPEEMREIAKMLAGAGAEVIHVSAGMAPSAQYSFLPAAVPKGMNVPLAEGIADVVDVPIIAAGAITDPEFAEGILSRGKIDLVAIGRPLMADPDLPVKAHTGRAKDIRPCLRCSKCAATWPDDVTCVTNVALGHEAVFRDLKPAKEPKKVLVIGAGPAGLETARIAAMRGHKVTVIDQQDAIGGKVHLARRVADKGNLDGWMTYYQREMDRLGVKIELNHKVTADDVAARAPEVIVVATGGKPLIPRSIHGADTPGVVVADDVLWDRVAVGERVLVIGGSSMGVETAEYIAAKGKRVVVVEQMHEILLDISHDAGLALMDKLALLEFKAITETVVTSIKQNHGKLDVHVKRHAQDTVLPGFDTVVMAVGVAPENALGHELKARFPHVHLVGDCAKPGDFRKATRDGANAGLSI